MQAFLDVGTEGSQAFGDALRDMAITIKSAGRVAAVSQLAANCSQHFIMSGPGTNHMFIGFTAILPVANQNDRSAVIASIAHEAAGVADRTGGVGQDAGVFLGRKVDEGAQPA